MQPIQLLSFRACRQARASSLHPSGVLTSAAPHNQLHRQLPKCLQNAQCLDRNEVTVKEEPTEVSRNNTP